MYRSFFSDAHYPVSFRTGSPLEANREQELLDMVDVALHTDQLCNGAASTVAEAFPKPA